MPTSSQTLDAPKGRSLTQDAIRRLARNKAAVVSIVVVIFIVLFAFIGPYFLPWSYDKIDWSGDPQAAQFRGRPLLPAPTRTVATCWPASCRARRCRLIVAGVATLVSVVIGIIYGAVAGYFGGRVDAVMMRFVDIMYALPYILFVIILVVIFGRSSGAAVRRHRLPRMADHGAHRARADAVASRSASSSRRPGPAGAKPWTIIFRHIVPNLTGPVVIYATLTIPEIILTESFLSYLGPGRAGAADLAGHADLGRRAGGRGAALDADRRPPSCW